MRKMRLRAAHIHSRSKNGVASLAYVGEPATTSPGYALAGWLMIGCADAADRHAACE
jgi:hypothetical protein